MGKYQQTINNRENRNQSYFQRILSCKSRKTARVITLAGSFGCLVNAIPALMIGAAASSTEWANTTLSSSLPPSGFNTTIILPLCLKHIIPGALMFVVLGALASGLLASCDSTLFGLATIMSQNIYRNWIKPEATERELIWMARGSVVVVSIMTLLLCLVWPKWHHYWILPYDILYVLVFPQLFCVVYFRYANTYGAISGLVVGAVLRIIFGESRINLRALLPLPFHDPEEGQLFPYRTLAMLGSLLTIIFVSILYHWLYQRGKLNSVNDIFLCFNSEMGSRGSSAAATAAAKSSRHWRRPESDSSFIDLRHFHVPAITASDPATTTLASPAYRQNHLPPTENRLLNDLPTPAPARSFGRQANRSQEHRNTAADHNQQPVMRNNRPPLPPKPKSRSNYVDQHSPYQDTVERMTSL